MVRANVEEGLEFSIKGAEREYPSISDVYGTEESEYTVSVTNPMLASTEDLKDKDASLGVHLAK